MRLASGRTGGAARALLAVAASGLAAGGCGGSAGGGQAGAAASSAPPRAACNARLAGVLAAAAGVRVDTVVRSPFTATDGSAGCRFTARRAPGGAVAVSVEWDSQPQAYYRLERGAVEYAQNVIWDHLGEAAYPHDVPHLGRDADWYPAEHEVQTSDGVRLVSVTVGSFPGGARAGERAAIALARTYLRTRG